MQALIGAGAHAGAACTLQHSRRAAESVVPLILVAAAAELYTRPAPQAAKVSVVTPLPSTLVQVAPTGCCRGQAGT